jgi:hypothetical protein
MTKKCENFLVDLMDDTESDDSDNIKSKTRKRLRKGTPKSEFIDEVWIHHDHIVDDDHVDLVEV